MSCLSAVLSSVKLGFEYILIAKGGFIYIVYFVMRYLNFSKDGKNGILVDDIVFFVGLAGLIAYFTNPLELYKRKGEKFSTSNSYSGMIQLYLLFATMIMQYMIQNNFIEISLSSHFCNIFFWIVFFICLTLLYYIQKKYDEKEYEKYDKYKKNPDFKIVSKYSLLPFIFTAIMFAYTSSYFVNYKFNDSTPKNIYFEIINTTIHNEKTSKGNILTYFAELKTDYTAIKKITISPVDYKSIKVGELARYELSEGFLNCPYLSYKPIFVKSK